MPLGEVETREERLNVVWSRPKDIVVHLRNPPDMTEPDTDGWTVTARLRWDETRNVPEGEQALTGLSVLVINATGDITGQIQADMTALLPEGQHSELIIEALSALGAEPQVIIVPLRVVVVSDA